MSIRPWPRYVFVQKVPNFNVETVFPSLSSSALDIQRKTLIPAWWKIKSNPFLLLVGICMRVLNCGLASHGKGLSCGKDSSSCLNWTCCLLLLTKLFFVALDQNWTLNWIQFILNQPGIKQSKLYKSGFAQWISEHIAFSQSNYIFRSDLKIRYWFDFIAMFT